MRAWHHLKSGEIDTLRTPLYPIFIGTICDMFGEGTGYHIVVVVQMLIYGIATVYMWKSLRILGLGELSAFVTVLLSMIINNYITGFNKHILTESLSISLCVFMLYFVLKSWHERSLPYILSFVFTAFLLLALRPGNIYIFPTAGLLLVTGAIYRKSANWWIGAGALAACCAVVLLYCSEIKKQTGIFAPSTVTVINKYMCMRGAGLIDPEEASGLPVIGGELAGLIEENGRMLGYDIPFSDHNNIDKELPLIVDNIGYSGLYEFIKESTQGESPDIIKSYFLRLYVMDLQAFAGLVTVRTVLLMVAFTLIAAFILWRRSHWRQLAGVSMFAALTALAQILLNAAYAPNDFQRLNVTALPFVILVFGQLLMMLQKKSLELKE